MPCEPDHPNEPELGRTASQTGSERNARASALVYILKLYHSADWRNKSCAKFRRPFPACDFAQEEAGETAEFGAVILEGFGADTLETLANRR